MPIQCDTPWVAQILNCVPVGSVTSPSLTSPARRTSSHAAWMSLALVAGLGRLRCPPPAPRRRSRRCRAARRVKRAVDRIGARDVAGQPLIVRRRVDQQQLAGLHLPARFLVVEDRRVRAAADDRRIAPAHRAVAQVDFFDRRFDFVLVLARARPRACPALCASLEIATLFRSTVCSYGVLIWRSAASDRAWRP